MRGPHPRHPCLLTIPLQPLRSYHTHPRSQRSRLHACLPRHPPRNRWDRRRTLMQVRYHLENRPSPTTCAARPAKNLSQVLENMDSLGEKSTVQSSCHHFVSFFRWRTRSPIQKATCVDARKQQDDRFRHIRPSSGRDAELGAILAERMHRVGGGGRERLVPAVAAPGRRCYTETRVREGRSPRSRRAERDDYRAPFRWERRRRPSAGEGVRRLRAGRFPEGVPRCWI
jgi:hypothetical protein